jgi:hypothetical protein
MAAPRQSLRCVKTPPDVLRHHIILTCEAEAQAMTTDAIIKRIFNAVPVP